MIYFSSQANRTDMPLKHVNDCVTSRLEDPGGEDEHHEKYSVIVGCVVFRVAQLFFVNKSRHTLYDTSVR